MHVADPESGETPLLTSLRAAAQLMEIKLVNSPHDQVGILLWNTVGSLVRLPLTPGRVEDDNTKQEWVPAAYDRVQPHQAGRRARHICASQSCARCATGCASLTAAAERDPDLLRQKFAPRDAASNVEDALVNVLHLLTVSYVLSVGLASLHEG